MREAIKKAVLKMFPELASGLHLDRYARVLAVNDAPTSGGICERFRPRYAVDLEVLTPDGETDEDYPTYEAVPLPLSIGGGMESGFFAIPEPGCLVVLGFAYGRPDHPIVRQIYPMGLSLPDITAGQMQWQQSATVLQDVDPDGNWRRISDQDITDESLTRTIKAVESVAQIARELREITENSTERVSGIKTLKALGALKLLSGGVANLSAIDALNLTTASDLNEIAARNRNERTGGTYKSVAPKFAFEAPNSGTSLLPLISSFMGSVASVLNTIATHTHPSIGAVCAQTATISSAATEIQSSQTDLDSISA